MEVAVGKEEFALETFVSLLITWRVLLLATLNGGGNVENYFRNEDLGQLGSSGGKGRICT